jgi:hypothetical protein
MTFYSVFSQLIYHELSKTEKENFVFSPLRHVQHTHACFECSPCKEISIYAFPKKELRGLSPNFLIL